MKREQTKALNLKFTPAWLLKEGDTFVDRDDVCQTVLQVKGCSNSVYAKCMTVDVRSYNGIYATRRINKHQQIRINQPETAK